MIPVFSSSSPPRKRRASGGPGAVGSESAAPCSGQGQALGTRFRGYDEKNGRLPSVKFVPLGIAGLCYAISATLLVADRARRRASSWTEARYIHASPLPTVASKSLASRRLRFSQAKVRSTTQRRGKTEKPVDRSERLTISICHCPCRASAVVSLSPRPPFFNGAGLDWPRVRPVRGLVAAAGN